MKPKNIHALARAVIINAQQIMLCKTVGLANNFYFLPGGHIEHNESATNALLRELKEESGFNFEIKRFLGCLEYIFEPTNMAVCHSHEYNLIFEAYSSALSENPIIPRLEEKIELLWIPLAQVADIDLKPYPLKSLISQWLNQNATGTFQSRID